MSDGEHLVALKTWAEHRGLAVQASKGTQQEPENVVAVVDTNGGYLLLRAMSLDSIDTAASYVIDIIDRLRLDD